MTTESSRLTSRIDANSLGHPHLIAAWTVGAAGCVIAMFLLPDREAVPYYLGWAGFALAFGFGTWKRWQLITSLAWYALATGVALDRSLRLGLVAWDEISTEVPLMILLTMLVAWQLRRSRTAQAQAMWLAERDVQASRDRRTTDAADISRAANAVDHRRGLRRGSAGPSLGA